MERSQYLEEVMDRQPGAMIAYTPEFEVVWRNRSAEIAAPSVRPGVNLYDALRPFTNEEKLDRLLLRGEKVMFGAAEGQPVLEWLVHHEKLSNGDEILMAWDPDITDEIVQRRATFSMAAAHELRSPLTALIGFAEILEMEPENLSPAQIEAVTIIRQNAVYLQTLVNDILDLTSNSFGELMLELEPASVVEPIEAAVRSLQESITARDQTVTMDLAAGLPEIEIDPRRVRQMVQNLVQNAHTHNPKGTRIDVSAEVRNDGIAITVADTGRGIPFDPPELAFGSFRHGGAIDFSQMTGSGIGLTVTKRLAELQRGTISVESSPDGSRFEIWLPIDRANAMTRIPPGPA